MIDTRIDFLFKLITSNLDRIEEQKGILREQGKIFRLVDEKNLQFMKNLEGNVNTLLSLTSMDIFQTKDIWEQISKTRIKSHSICGISPQYSVYGSWVIYHVSYLLINKETKKIVFNRCGDYDSNNLCLILKDSLKLFNIQVSFDYKNNFFILNN